MMDKDAAHKSRWRIAEVVFGIPFLAGIALRYLIPLPLSSGILKQALILAGIALTITGICFIILTRREFAEHGQPRDPGQPTSKVVTTGVFAISRNPLYLGSTIFLLGIALLMNTLWTLAMLFISYILCHFILIIPEERYLAAKFGREYDEYTASVNRWLGRK